MSSDYSILQCAVFDFSESVCTVSQVLNTYVREVEAGTGEDFVQVTTEEYGRLNIFRALVEFDTPARGFGGLYLITGEVLEDDSEHEHRMQDIYEATAHLV